MKCLLESPGNLTPKLEIALRIANTEYEYRAVLRDIGTRRYKNIIVDLEPSQAQIVLKMALQLGMINSTYHYVLTTMDIETINLDDFKYNRANITGMRLVKTDSPFYQTMLLNLNQYAHQHLFKKSTQSSSSEINNNNNYYYNSPVNSLEGSFRTFLTTKNALIFDAIYMMATVINEAEKTLNLREGHGVSCSEHRPFSHGSLLSTFVEKVAAQGLTGGIRFQDKQRKEFELDVLQLKETGLFKCGSWSNELGLNFTFYDEIYEEEANSLKKGVLRVVTLVVSWFD